MSFRNDFSNSYSLLWLFKSYHPVLDVAEFHNEFGLEINSKPTLVDKKTKHLREDLIQEELDELCKAEDIVEVADALGDLLYVVLGAFVTYGINPEPVFNEIHRSNMSKVGGHKAPNGKWIKPDTYSPADIKKVLEEMK